MAEIKNHPEPHQFVLNRWMNHATRVEITLDKDATIGEVLEAFTGFLQASGYSIPKDSHLDFVSDDENTNPVY